MFGCNYRNCYELLNVCHYLINKIHICGKPFPSVYYFIQQIISACIYTTNEDLSVLDIYFILYAFYQTDDVYTIDSELVAILKNSRFSDEFEFQPATKGVCGSTGNTVS